MANPTIKELDSIWNEVVAKRKEALEKLEEEDYKGAVESFQEEVSTISRYQEVAKSYPSVKYIGSDYMPKDAVARAKTELAKIDEKVAEIGKTLEEVKLYKDAKNAYFTANRACEEMGDNKLAKSRFEEVYKLAKRLGEIK
jgi:hypothetical protein